MNASCIELMAHQRNHPFIHRMQSRVIMESRRDWRTTIKFRLHCQSGKRTSFFDSIQFSYAQRRHRLRYDMLAHLSSFFFLLLNSLQFFLRRRWKKNPEQDSFDSIKNSFRVIYHSFLALLVDKLYHSLQLVPYVCVCVCLCHTRKNIWTGHASVGCSRKSWVFLLLFEKYSSPVAAKAN